MKCGSLIDLHSKGAIKEPRFMKNTSHLDPFDLFKQMCQDQKAVVSKMIDMQYSQEGSSTARTSSNGSFVSGQ